MSILAATATVPEPTNVAQLAFAGGLIGFGALVAYLLGVFRTGSVSGPMRPAPTTSATTIFVLLVIALVTWFGMQFIYGMARAVQHSMSGSTEPLTVASFTPLDYSLLATIPYVAGFLVLAVGDRLAKPTLPRELGWSSDQLPGGVARALLAMISVLPIMFGAGLILEALYQAVGYEHPTEHELLTALGKSRQTVIKVLIIGGATLLAPVFEEFLFRGHLQTLLVRAFSPRPRRTHAFPVIQGMPPPPMPPPPMPPPPPPMTIGTGDTAVGETMAPASPPVGLAPTPPRALVPDPEPIRPPSPAARWAAIAITSLLFAVLHPTWTWPLIFLLSLALGYAYERTANLWVPVTMHLVFNTFNTVLFLYMQPL